jgi:hypothetical protein
MSVDKEGYEEVSGKPKRKGPDWEAKDRRIARLACIKAATEFHAASIRPGEVIGEMKLDAEATSIIRMARRFEAYVYER